MDENIKKHINLYKFLVFPWGIITTAPIWYGIVKAITNLLNGIDIICFTPLAKIILYVVGEIGIISFLFLFPRILPKGKKKDNNLYILIYPENFDDDKYISYDFISDYTEYTRNISNLQIILPSVLKRRWFNRKIERFQKQKKNYWDSKSWKNLHRKMKGTIYITGKLLKRNANKKEHFVFQLTATIGYYDLNKDLTQTMIQEMQLNFPSKILIDKEFEFEQFDFFSSRFATLSEYLIGWSHLVSGNILFAYELHKDIFINNKQSFYNKGYLKDIEKVIYFEAKNILINCKLFPKERVEDCANTILKLFPNDCMAIISVASSLIMTSTEENFSDNVGEAISMISKVRINKETRSIVHANRAYLFLLSKKYDQAEKEYKEFFSRPFRYVANQIIEYCDGQIMNGTECEKPTACYVKLLMQVKTKVDREEVLKTYYMAMKMIPKGHYYRKKIGDLNINLNIKK